MKLPKKLFLSAAILLGSACVASAATVKINDERTVDVGANLSNDYYVTSSGNLTLNISASHTLKGHFYGSSSWIEEGGGPVTLGADYRNGGYYGVDDIGKIEITGGGTLEYQGFSDIDYYSRTYLLANGQAHGVYEQSYTTSLIGIGSDGNVDIEKTAFSGQLTISGGTTLKVSGYLSQYVGYYRPSEMVAIEPEEDELGYVGVSNLVLKDSSVLSFESSKKNLLSLAFDLSDSEAGAPEDAVGVRALNFLHNVKADINTEIELGTDRESTARIIVSTTDAGSGANFGWDGETVIGKLSGTGRIYFVEDINNQTDECFVSITNRAEFATLSENGSSVSSLGLNPSSETSVLNYVRNLSATYDLTGYVRTTTEEGEELATGVLADVFLLTNANIGSDSTGKYVVDNVLETATAVQLQATLRNMTPSFDSVERNFWEVRPDYVDRGAATVTIVNIYGTQILNNFQSLSSERSTILAQEGINDGYFEVATMRSSFAAGSSVVIRNGGTLILNQQEDRDGVFDGRFVAGDIETGEINDGYIIKAGVGKFTNVTDKESIINRLFIYEGEWVANSNALGEGRIYVGNLGALSVVSDKTETFRARIEGPGASVLTFSYRSYPGTLQIVTPQNDFYGTVKVDDDMALVLGMLGGSELDSVFSNASKIELVEDARLIVQSHQILPSIEGNKDSSLSFSATSNYDAVAVLTGAGKFAGKITGTGSIVKAGTQGLTIDVAGHTLSTIGLTGAISLEGENALVQSSGVVLVNASTLMSEKAQHLATLIGAKDSTVMLGASQLTVGLTKDALLDVVDAIDGYYSYDETKVNDPDYREKLLLKKIANDGYFFATADKEAYLGGSGLNLTAIDGFINSDAAKAIEALGVTRPAYLRVDVSGDPSLESFTALDTVNYLKDPAKLANTFAHIYATIDAGTFDTIRESSIWTGLGIEGNNLSEVFNQVLDLKTIRDFVASKPTGWTERELTDLLSYAETYYSNPSALLVADGVNKKALTRAGYLALKDANVIKYIAKEYGTGLTDEQLAQADTLHGFISLFFDELGETYKFRFTNENVDTLVSLYGFNAEGLKGDGVSYEEKYVAFENLIGIQYADGELPAFAGTISGEGASLNKVGEETLRLTGVNTYTGVTIVEAGELRVDWDAIPATAGVQVHKGALLTLVSEIGESPCRFEIGTEGVISGEGTILKDGEGTLVIESALGYQGQPGQDFTGEIVVGKGALIVNAGERREFAESVNIYLNEGTSLGLNVGTIIEDTEEGTVEVPQILLFKGEIIGGAPLNETASVLVKDGGGKLVFSQGDALGKSTNRYNFDVKAGEMELQFADSGDFRDGDFEALLGDSATLRFSVGEDKEVSFAGCVLKADSATSTAFVKDGSGVLALARPDTANKSWDIDVLSLEKGMLRIAEGAAYRFGKITTNSDTAFVIDGTLTVSGTEEHVFGGLLTGTGTLEKIGNGTLSLADIQFGGSVLLKGGELVLDVGVDDDGNALKKNLAFKLSVDGTPGISTSLVKQGVGTAIFANEVDLSGVDLSVKAGMLTVNGDKFVGNAPKSIEIASGATFKIDPAKSGFDLATVQNGLSGAGTLALGSGVTTVSDVTAIKNFSGTFDLNGADITFAAGINSIGGIAGTGTVTFDDAEQTITLAPNRDVVFKGALDTADNVTLVVAGNGVLDISDATFATGSSIRVDSGNVSVGLDDTAAITLAKDGSTLGLVGSVDGQVAYNGTVKIESGVSEIGIALEGAVDLSKDAFSALFKNVDGGSDLKEVTLANRNGADLTLKLVGADEIGLSLMNAATTPKKPYDFSDKGISLATSVGGTLTLETSSTAYSHAEYSKEITGAGNLEKTGEGELHLTSLTQGYTGKTIVSEGTLAFASGTELMSSGIEVKGGATLQGGITLVAENASVNFGYGATYRINLATGEALRYSGEVDAHGQVALDVNATQADRGKALSIFEYVGEGSAKAINKNRFSLSSSGSSLYIDQAELAKGNLKVYVAQENFRDTGADLHDGIDELVDILSDWAKPVDGYLKQSLYSEEEAIADALNKTSLGELGDAINNLSPLAYASMVSMPHAGFSADIRAVSSRLEQRLYDSGSAVWIYDRDVEFFAQAQGSTVDGGSDSDSMVYDYNTYGALAGMDIKFNKETTAGFAVAYDHGKADVHAGGGDIESDDIRATVFVGHLINDYLSLNAGAQIGYATYDVERNTLLGKNKGDTDGWHGGIFADVVGACVLAEWGDSARLDFFPHAGLALSYYRVDKFEEKASGRDDFGSSLATDSFDAFSLQARVGGTLNCAFEVGDYATRVGLDLSLIHEFLDDEVEIESWISDSKFKTDARAISGTSLSVAPSISVDLDSKTSVYLNYEFRIGTESEVAHRANLGFRYRF